LDSLSGAFRALPDAAPLAMPTQSLRAAPPRGPDPASSPSGMLLRRLAVIGSAVVLTGLGLWQMELVLAVNGLTPLAIVMLVLFLPLFAWVALSFTSALAGFVSVLGGGGRRLGIGTGDLPPLHSRTALLMPCYNENPARVMAGLQAIWESLDHAGAAGNFDVFVLSDTTDPDVWVEEEAAFLRLRRATGCDRIFYRRRAENTARKAGNIADWVTRWGADYPQFLILDADSVMEAATLVRLAAAMEAHPDVGLIQTLPIIVGGTTLFARLQQFAGRVYGPLIAQGIAWWHGSEGNYWGHNAIIRTRAFAEQAGLPELPGRKPFGGHILSHDFVEAALIRRGGWAVHMVPALAGSFEESPPSLIDLAVRDRRWCQGNLQHAAVLLRGRGLSWISRLHLLTGIGSYITAPLWLLFLLSGILIALQARFALPDYFPDGGKSLFPAWPVVDPVRAMWMFIGTMGLLLVPKLLGFLLVLGNGPARRGCGGMFRLSVSLLLETLVSGLLAPVVMLTQSVDVVSILSGRDSGWNAQRRDDGSVPAGVILRQFRRHTLLGVAMGVGAWFVSPALALWMSPVVLGLALAIPLVAVTSRRFGMLARLGVLRIPEEVRQPPVLARANALQRQFAAGDSSAAPARLRADPALLAAHLAMLPPPRRPGIDPLNVPLLLGRARLEEAAFPDQAWSKMTRHEQAACLADAEALRLLIALPARQADLSAGAAGNQQGLASHPA
jgi:membrane glycosyltransferase